MTDNRKYEIARFIRISDDPEKLTKEQLIEEIFTLGEYASHRVTECHTLRNIIKSSLNK